MRLRLSLIAIAACLFTAAVAASDLHVSPVSGEDLQNVAGYYDNGGVLLKALTYPDAYGNERILAFGGNKHGAKRDSESYVSLHAYGLIQDHGGYLARWEIKESNGGLLCGLRMLTPLVDIIDAGDGQALVVVPYWIDCDGLDPTDLKLIMVYKDRKYAIRGSLPHQQGDEITRTPGETFKELPAAVQKTALAYWEKVLAAAQKAGADRGEPDLPH
ncbi:M949_RS01915 family surface polysaccharide biosynthesis protein [Dyella silvatica]|uniref:M949_RS01915 family surface polysaccharide biosynthesis protein n=1 Tax=Dyella silvatica TaxID=2992128 RepID=UPI002250E7D8|nr:hypothetical protein [Dyella silvatica]